MAVAAADARPTTARSSAIPRGLSTLFFTEMWERFSYYGMRALLILFMTAPVAAGGLGFDTAVARRDLRPLHVDGLHDQPAGRLDRRSADRPAPRRALRRHPDRVRPLQHGVPVAARRSTSASSLIVVGTGLLKGNVSVDRRPALRAGRHPPRRRLLDLLHGHQPRRVHRAAGLRLSRPARSTGTSASRAAGVGMVLGLVQYVLGAQVPRRRRPASRAGRIARRPRARLKQRVQIWRRRRDRRGRRCSPSACTGALPITAKQIADAAGVSCSLHRRSRSSRWLFLAGDWTPRRAQAALRDRACCSSPRRCSGPSSSRRARR